MTRDDIICMAREAGFSVGVTDPVIYAAHARFAALVAAQEREACARVADKQDGDEEGDVEACIWSKAARHIAAAIRARAGQ